MKSTYPGLVGLFTLVSILLAGPAVAAQCKGLAKDPCAAETACSWVDGYTRKDGRTVSAHCKSRPAGKADSDAGAEAPKLGQAG